jgi:molybdopterin converting factor small subunit
MDVRVRLPTQLRDLAAGASTVVVAVDVTPVTVSSVLDSLATTHPALERRVRDETGRTRVHVNLFVDADNIRDLDGVATTVADGSDVSIIPAISGGS